MSVKMLGKPAIGETLHAEQELDNVVDKFAVKVVKNNATVSPYTGVPPPPTWDAEILAN